MSYTETPYQVICVLGSSTANGYWDEEGLGWVGRLSVKLAKKYPYKFGFNNLAKAGDRSVNILHRMRVEVPWRDPDVIVIALGTNDLIRLNSPDAQTALSEDESKAAWYELLQLAKKQTDRVLVFGPLSAVEARLPYKIGKSDLYLWNRDAALYNEKVKEWCSEFKCDFIDNFSAWDTDDLPNLLYDTVHANAKGHQRIADTVFDKMAQLGWLEERAA